MTAGAEGRWHHSFHTQRPRRCSCTSGSHHTSCGALSPPQGRPWALQPSLNSSPGGEPLLKATRGTGPRFWGPTTPTSLPNRGLGEGGSGCLFSAGWHNQQEGCSNGRGTSEVLITNFPMWQSWWQGNNWKRLHQSGRGPRAVISSRASCWPSKAAARFLGWVRSQRAHRAGGAGLGSLLLPPNPMARGRGSPPEAGGTRWGLGSMLLSRLGCWVTTLCAIVPSCQPPSGTSGGAETPGAAIPSVPAILQASRERGWPAPPHGRLSQLFPASLSPLLYYRQSKLLLSEAG